MAVKISFSKIYSEENLMWSWNKLMHYYENESDFIPNIEEYYSFNLNIKQNIKNLSNKIKYGKFKTHKIYDMYMPKKFKDGHPVSRPYYHINIEDQIVWIAVMNIIGPVIDEFMPFWSFGNRLNVPQWIDENNERRIGVYRLSSKSLYRPWRNGWSWYRRTVALTCKIMTTEKGKKFNEISGVDEDDERNYNAFGTNSNPYIPNYLKIQYFNLDYWAESRENLFYCTLDLEKFYPNVNINLIKQNLSKYLFKNSRIEFDEQEKIEGLIEILLRFNFAKKNKINKGIPTGLYVAGFLSNIAILDIDKKMDIYREAKLKEGINIANFRYVDDQIILSNNFIELIKAVKYYEVIIETFGEGLKINKDKYEPDGIKNIIKMKEFNQEGLLKKKKYLEVFNKSKIDPDLSNPFSTATLKRVSIISKKNINFLDESEKEDVIQELLVLLKSDLDEKEIAPKTKFSWITTLLGKIVPTMERTSKDKLQLLEDINNLYRNLDKTIKQKSATDGLFKKEIFSKECETSNKQCTLITKKLIEIDEIISKLIKEIKEKETELYKYLDNNKKFEEIFEYLKKSLDEYYYLPAMWSKVISYCKLTGLSHVKEIFNIVINLRSRNIIDGEGYSYIMVIILQEICNQMISIVRVNNNDLTIRKISDILIKRNKNFMDSILENRKLIIECNKNCKYAEDKIILFNLLCDYNLDNINLVLNDNTNIINLYADEKIFKNLSNKIIYNLNKNNVGMNNYLCANKKRIDYESLQSIKMPEQYNEFLIKEEIKIRNSEVKLKNKLTFLEFIKNLENGNLQCIDNEYVIVSIVIKLIDEIIKYESKNIFDTNDDHFRYDYNDINLTIDLEKMRSCLDTNDYLKFVESIIVDFKYIKKKTVDIRYSPEFFTLNEFSVKEFRKIYFIGLILISMLSKNMDCPTLVNLYPTSINLSKLHLKRIGYLNITSVLYALIKGCIVQKEYEFMFSKEFIAIDVESRNIDFDYDPIPIKDLKQLRKYLLIIKEYLKNNIYSYEEGCIKIFKNITSDIYCKNNNPLEKGDINE